MAPHKGPSSSHTSIASLEAVFDAIFGTFFKSHLNFQSRSSIRRNIRDLLQVIPQSAFGRRAASLKSSSAQYPKRTQSSIRNLAKKVFLTNNRKRWSQIRRPGCAVGVWLFQSAQRVSTGCSRVGRQWLQAVPE